MKSKVKCVLTFGLSGNDDLKEIKVINIELELQRNWDSYFSCFSFENDIIFF